MCLFCTETKLVVQCSNYVHMLSGLLSTLTYEILDLMTSGTLLKHVVCNLKYFSVLRKVHDYLWPTSYSYGKMNLVILPSPLHQEAHISYKLQHLFPFEYCLPVFTVLFLNFFTA